METLEKTSDDIAAGTACILIRDKDLLGERGTAFREYLNKEGFQIWSRSKGVYDGVDWIYVNLNSKCYANGIPGASVTAMIGNHAVTLEEFKIIYRIFKKYEGLEVLMFSKKEQEDRHRKIQEADAANKKFWEEMNFEKYLSLLKLLLADSLRFLSEAELSDYIESEVKYIKQMYDERFSPYQVAYGLFMMW